MYILSAGSNISFIRFPQLFALLQRRLSSEQRTALKNCYIQYEDLPQMEFQYVSVTVFSGSDAFRMLICNKDCDHARSV
ncbi:hypothetical protein KC19_VG090500 [Ceratodon purpureus]|uniref:Uncharacterized protein n=1 Tax=Ceratodon purpureus TaxID=3225 RepID=A0A8T0HNK0_CERPU|nr:hypothetical protein KC19_VG090500 [Ceratodon purpureus]